MSDFDPSEVEVCPVLSSPARRDAKGKEVPPALVPCLGTGCKLYRVEEDRCSLLEVPGVVDQVRELGTSAEEGLAEASTSFQSAVTRVSRFLEGWQRAIESAGQRFSEIQKEMGETAETTAAEVRGVTERMEQSGIRQDRLMHALDAVLRRLTEEKRAEEARQQGEAGERLLREGDLEQALFQLQRAKGGSGSHPRLLNALGCAYLRLGRFEEAVRTLTSCRKSEPAFAPARVNLGYALSRLDRSDEAEKELRDALELDPTSAAGWNTLGNLHYRAERFDEAEECWTRAVELDPGLEPAWVNLRRQQLLDNRPFEALVARADPPRPRAEAPVEKPADAPVEG